MLETKIHGEVEQGAHQIMNGTLIKLNLRKLFKITNTCP